MSGLKDNQWTNYLNGKSSTFNFSYLSNSDIPDISNAQINNYTTKMIIPSHNKNKNILPTMSPMIRGGDTRRKKNKRTKKSKK
jgi:hypothetical protein